MNRMSAVRGDYVSKLHRVTSLQRIETNSFPTRRAKIYIGVWVFPIYNIYIFIKSICIYISGVLSITQALVSLKLEGVVCYMSETFLYYNFRAHLCSLKLTNAKID